MKISTKGRYAVRLMYDLAMHHTGDWIALKDISRRQEISVTDRKTVKYQGIFKEFART